MDEIGIFIGYMVFVIGLVGFWFASAWRREKKAKKPV
jgi:hypothetical protein